MDRLKSTSAGSKFSVPILLDVCKSKIKGEVKDVILRVSCRVGAVTEISELSCLILDTQNIRSA